MTLSLRISQGLNQHELSEQCISEETEWDKCLHDEPDCWSRQETESHYTGSPLCTVYYDPNDHKLERRALSSDKAHEQNNGQLTWLQWRGVTSAWASGVWDHVFYGQSYIIHLMEEIAWLTEDVRLHVLQEDKASSFLGMVHHFIPKTILC